MTLPLRIQKTRLRHAATYPGQGIWRVYVDGVELLNPNGLTPVLKQLGTNEGMALAALNGVSEDVIFWRVRHLGQRQPINASWSLSLDGGATSFSVQCTTITAKAPATSSTAPCFEYFLRGNPN